MSLKRLTILSMYTIIMVISEYFLTFVPSIQLTMLLVVLLSSNFSRTESLMVVFVHTLVDNLLYGGIGLYTIPMLISWSLIVLQVHELRKFNPVNPGRYYAVLSLYFAFVYAIPFAIMSVIVYEVNLWHYLVADFPFTMVLAFTSYVSIDLFYEPLNRVLGRFL